MECDFKNVALLRLKGLLDYRHYLLRLAYLLDTSVALGGLG